MLVNFRQRVGAVFVVVILISAVVFAANRLAESRNSGGQTPLSDLILSPEELPRTMSKIDQFAVQPTDNIGGADASRLARVLVTPEQCGQRRIDLASESALYPVEGTGTSGQLPGPTQVEITVTKGSDPGSVEKLRENISGACSHRLFEDYGAGNDSVRFQGTEDRILENPSWLVGNSGVIWESTRTDWISHPPTPDSLWAVAFMAIVKVDRVEVQMSAIRDDRNRSITSFDPKSREQFMDILHNQITKIERLSE